MLTLVNKVIKCGLGFAYFNCFYFILTIKHFLLSFQIIFSDILETIFFQGTQSSS